MPSICGVASTSLVAFALFKPRACNVSFCRSGLSIGLFTKVIFIFFIPQTPKGALIFLKMLIVIQVLKSATQQKFNQGTEAGNTIIN